MKDTGAESKPILNLVGRRLTLVPVPIGPAFPLMSNGVRTRTAWRGVRTLTIGKGKYGKRTASASIDYGHSSSNDNSNDSGLDCDNSNSGSQYWGSSEDLRTIGQLKRRQASVGGLQRNQGAVRQLVIPQFQPSGGSGSTGKDLSTVDLQKSLNIFTPSSSGAEIILVDQVNGVSNPQDEDKKILGQGPDNTQSMSPVVSIGENGQGTIQEGAQMSQPLLTFGKQQPTMNPSSIPTKRARFSFQTPTAPMRPVSGLRLRNQNQSPMVRGNSGKLLPPGTTPTLSSNVAPTSRDGKVQLQILAQPEEQHRARYQTEGSRGAIKDRKGNGFPTVKLIGYDKPATLQIFIGSDQGKVSPHMFYQACKVTGKSSTPCIEKKAEGTVLIEIEFELSKDMVISCDCVGILKERNVDVEQRFPFHHAASSRKKSTRCRLIYRTTIINSDGMQETLQVSSLPILCTQPPGQPEICKQSLSECCSKGGQELFIIGKNFLKDTKVVVQEETMEGEVLWEARAEILKDYLQQNHLICVLPPYKDENIGKAVNCRVSVWSGGKLSEPHHLTYLPNNPNVVYGLPTSSPSRLSPDMIDSQAESQAMIQNTLQQQMTLDSMLSVEIPMGAGSLMNNNETAVPNAFITEAGTIGQMSDLVQTPITTSAMNAISTMNYENSMMVPVTTAQQERQVMSELQEILDQSSQQGLMSMGAVDTKPNTILGPTSFFGMNLVGSMEVQPTFQQSPIITQTSPVSVCQQPSTTFNEMNPLSLQDMNRRQSNPNIGSFEQTVTVGSVMPQMMSMVQPSVESQILCSTTTASEEMMNCMNQTMKTESNSADTGTILCSQQEQQQQQGMNVMNLMGGDLQGDQGSIANALTKMSDSELLCYINPNCFEQDVK